MHITLETDYAIRIMDCLAKEQQRMGAQQIADRTQVTLRFSLKILRKLVQSGMIQSFKGAQGGYEMVTPVSEITLNDILTTIEGPYMFSRCLDEDHVCFRNSEEDTCPYHAVFADISETVISTLSSATLDQFIPQK